MEEITERKGLEDGEKDRDDDGDDLKPFTVLQTILSVVPFTAEYKIAQSAFEMLDNLQRIQKEKAKANDLMIQAKIGLHEEVRDGEREQQ